MRKSAVKSKDISAPGVYEALVNDLSGLIKQSRYQAAKLVNREVLLLYFASGKLLHQRIADAEWGDQVLESVSSGIQGTFAGIRGFSTRNLKNMRRFYQTYAGLEPLLKGLSATARITTKKFGQSITAQIDRVNNIPAEMFLGIGFTHHVLIMQKCGTMKERRFYMQQCILNQWSVSILEHHIESSLYQRKGKLASNFGKTMPVSLKKHALEAFKDEYLLNFISITEEDSERVLESELVANIRAFLMSLGREFCFMGNQYRMVVDGEEFFVDLLFYHRKLQALIAIDLKAGKFKPEQAGKMNFYLEALDQTVKLPHENPSIGIILCKEKKNTIVEFAFKRVDRPMGVATYALRKSLPPDLGKFLPAPADLKKAADRK